MRSLRPTVIDALNRFVDDQRAVADEGARLAFSLVQFDTNQRFEVVIDAVPVVEVRELTLDDYRPRGGKPLLDAVGRLIETLDQRVARTPDEDQIVFIVTDGLENASTDFDLDDIGRLIDARDEAGWTFLYLGANHDSFEVAHHMGVGAGNTRNFAGSDQGAAEAFAEVSASVRAQRGRDRGEREQRRGALFDERSSRDDLLGGRKPGSRRPSSGGRQYFRPRQGESSQQMARRIREALDPAHREDRS